MKAQSAMVRLSLSQPVEDQHRNDDAVDRDTLRQTHQDQDPAEEFRLLGQGPHRRRADTETA